MAPKRCSKRTMAVSRLACNRPNSKPSSYGVLFMAGDSQVCLRSLREFRQAKVIGGFALFNPHGQLSQGIKRQAFYMLAQLGRHGSKMFFQEPKGDFSPFLQSAFFDAFLKIRLIHMTCSHIG